MNFVIGKRCKICGTGNFTHAVKNRFRAVVVEVDNSVYILNYNSSGCGCIFNGNLIFTAAAEEPSENLDIFKCYGAFSNAVAENQVAVYGNIAESNAGLIYHNAAVIYGINRTFLRNISFKNIMHYLSKFLTGYIA